ncbi:MAG: hypothetical protein DHS20C18_37790 [Saprospiraceae bacterium]|nr:MAG: hypothetical protein DHS20C18_37790 [Saprospiraceae bacterium]
MKNFRLIALAAVLIVLNGLAIIPAIGQGNSGDAPEFVLFKYYADHPIGVLPITNVGDSLGTIYFKAKPQLGSPFRTGASIQTMFMGPTSADSLPASLIFRTGSIQQHNRMAINPQGLVGIGTLYPEYNLHTVGNTHTTGDFYGRIHFDDNRTTDEAPDTYIDEAYFELKELSAFANKPGSLTQDGGLLTLAPGATSNDHQLFFGDDGIFTRRYLGGAPDWGAAAWYKILTSEDINGTPNRIAKFTGPSSLGDSQLWDDGVQVGIGTDSPTAGYLMDIAGTTRMGGNTDVTANLSVAQDASIGDDLQVNGNTNINGFATVDGFLTVNNSATITQNLTVNQSAFVNLDLSVTDDANIGDDLNVGGTAIITDAAAIGTSTIPSGFKLAVDGKVICEELKVQMSESWPDYVFGVDYQRPDLTEWEQFIKTNQHLPGIPSAAEVAENGGIEVGETQRLLLEKIEQLTLILIDQKKQIEQLETTVKSIQK